MSAKPQPYGGQTVDDYLVNFYLPWLEETAGARIDALIDQTANEIGILRGFQYQAGKENVDREIDMVRNRLKNVDAAAKEQAHADAEVLIKEMKMEGPTG